MGGAPGEAGQDKGDVRLSGIGAVFSFDGSPIPSADVERMRNVLAPYGPDRQRIVVRSGSAFVACIHQLTPEDSLEQQPLLVEDRFVALFDGRLDNREELAAALGISGGDLSAMSDSVLAFRAWSRWQEKAFAAMTGVFAVIVADVRTGELV